MKHYLSAIDINVKGTANNTIVQQTEILLRPDFTTAQTQNLYHYPVPQESEVGCGLKAKEPYCLEDTLGLRSRNLLSHPNTERLWRLNKIIEELEALTKVDWIGIYRVTKNLEREPVLLKEAYYGRFSRAEFPLTAEFAKGSNNSTVGLSKKAILVQSVEAYEGPYYTCDTAVQSEFCLPILGPTGALLGIIDAEAFKPEFFTDEKILEITKVAYDLGQSELLDFSVDEQ